MSSIAARNISDDKISERMSSTIVEVMPLKLAELGIVAETKVIFCAGPVFVIKM